MKIPSPPPHTRPEDLLAALEAAGDQAHQLIITGGGAAEYLPWDALRFRDPPSGLDHRQWWALIKMSRASMRREVPLRDGGGAVFSYQPTNRIRRGCHEVDQKASGRVASDRPTSIQNEPARDRYVISSLLEEAVRSSQLEGAATTRARAKEMLRSQRAPRTVDEQMVLNNYRAMQFVRELRGEPLSPDSVVALHRVMIDGTLGEERTSWIRTEEDDINVVDGDGQVLHRPPAADELHERLAAMCAFANATDDEVFIHPVVRAIVLHFWLAYDHPFVDGNGRTARAVFYWALLNSGYWLAEFVSISRILKAAPAQYARSFLHVEQDDNDLTYFIHHQLDAVLRAIEELDVYLKRKAVELRSVESALRTSSTLNHRQRALVAHALRHGGATYTVRSHQTSHGVAYETARTDLLELAEKGLLTQQKVSRTFHFHPARDLEARLRALR